MEECKPIGVPLDPKVKLQKNANGNDESKGFPYQQAVGFLMYAMLCTRPDLAYPISVLSQHMATLTWSIGWPSNESFDICKVHCK